MKGKNKHLDYSTENLAFPEVHIDNDTKEETDKSEADDKTSGGDMVFDNLAIPEIKSSGERLDSGRS
ncbi:hypothetical protein [uncultured Ruminococcus sp.]|uniref:hypothetical protein n=1 Tax=uncultured Ruminococcus sp. TaxID=165186 RepID=UPI0025F01D5B|nr:hypothetical protein [uncultured Ruminococcus sp.]